MWNTILENSDVIFCHITPLHFVEVACGVAAGKIIQLLKQLSYCKNIVRFSIRNFNSIVLEYIDFEKSRDVFNRLLATCCCFYY